MDKLFFDSWESIARTFFITILAYVAMVILLRSSGKRTLSKMNAFDFIVTVALGSSLATVSLSKSVTLVDGILAFFLLIFLQYSITWLSVRVDFIKDIVTSRPVLLLYKGKLLKDVLKKERITLEEIHVAVRKKGISDLQQVEAIVLETTGDITIVKEFSREPAETMQHVKRYPEQQSR